MKYKKMLIVNNLEKFEEKTKEFFNYYISNLYYQKKYKYAFVDGIYFGIIKTKFDIANLICRFARTHISFIEFRHEKENFSDIQKIYL